MILGGKNLISIDNKYIFKYIKNVQTLQITYNHRILADIAWITANKMSEETKISTSKQTKNVLIENSYVKTAIFALYSKTYDINKYSYPNIICNTNIIHNSIEQDADIIIILHETQNAKYMQNSDREKIIDLKILKNRNGQTGYCQLLFEPYTNIFKNMN